MQLVASSAFLLKATKGTSRDEGRSIIIEKPMVIAKLVHTHMGADKRSNSGVIFRNENSMTDEGQSPWKSRKQPERSTQLRARSSRTLNIRVKCDAHLRGSRTYVARLLNVSITRKRKKKLVTILTALTVTFSLITNSHSNNDRSSIQRASPYTWKSVWFTEFNAL